MSEQLDDFVPDSLRGMAKPPPRSRKPLTNQDYLLRAFAIFLLFVVIAAVIGWLQKLKADSDRMATIVGTGRPDPNFRAPEAEPAGWEYEAFEIRFCDALFADLYYEVEGSSVMSPTSLIRTMGIYDFEYEGTIRGELLFKRKKKRYQPPIKRELVQRRKIDVPQY